MWDLAPSSSSTNLRRFLHCVTPNPPSSCLPKGWMDTGYGDCGADETLFSIGLFTCVNFVFQSCIGDLNSLWQPADKDNIEYYSLADLWNCYEEWSAYGVATQVVKGSGESITQYFAPYLSGIQIYTDKCAPVSRSQKEDSDVLEVESDSWSDDSGSDKLSRSLTNNSSRTWDAISEDSNFDQDSSLSMRDKLGYLYLEYLERSSPYFRVPLMDKITELARSHPGLMTLKSLDLSPASWMAVAWYPIYHIPFQRNKKDLAACFLTYHTLSLSFQDTEVEYDENNSWKETCYTKGKQKEGSSSMIPLSPFGLATYKMQGNLWVKPDTCDPERMMNLYGAADSWLKQLNVHHHDFNFFSFHSKMYIGECL
ncbi:uncharacterized protein LOC111303343 [Durio zibethinus]|uniref:Uncharacterized protein LOC111303343 n=1 Tax=Durio zibethinus TaxID=66656 RepID=A0A6P5ZQX5_DURZI|nr:uncharacterized protein LOC111303343 [Durio zibethinus]